MLGTNHLLPFHLKMNISCNISAATESSHFCLRNYYFCQLPADFPTKLWHISSVYLLNINKVININMNN